jgi:hypothetical protein
MTKYLAGVLSILTVGVLLVAYGLLSPRVSAVSYPNQNPYAAPAAYAYGAQPGFGSNGAVPCDNGASINYPYAVPHATPVSAQQSVRSEDIVERAPVRRRTTRTVVRAPRRDWKKTALVVGGSTATAAGIGGLIGGSKGALVGAALGGGISTIYETQKRR